MRQTVATAIRTFTYFAILLTGGLLSLSSDATTIGVKKCTEPCTTMLQLKNDVRQSSLGQSLPFGSVVFVSGTTSPLSAYVQICPGPRGGKDACPITPDEVAAADLDNSTHVRAMGLPPITIPPEVASTPSDVEPVQQFITTTINVTGPNGTGWWHGIITGNFQWYEVFDNRSNTTTDVYINDRIVAKFSNGQTAEYRFVGPYVTAGMMYHIVEGSIRNADGSDPAASPPQADVSDGTIDLFPSWPGSIGSIVDWFPSMNICSVRSTICVDSYCFARDYQMPC